MANPHYQVSRDAAAALTEYSEEFKSALTIDDSIMWAEDVGYVRTSDAMSTVFPIPIDALDYREFKGDIKFQSLYERSLRMKTKEWEAGVEIEAAKLEAPDFVDWAGAPSRIAQEWKRLPNEIVSDLLALDSRNGPLLSLYDDPDTETKGTRRLFANDHPFNLLKSSVGTFTNYTTTTVADILSGEFWDAAEDYFRSIKGPNGKKMGLTVQGGRALVPGTRNILFKRSLEADTLVNAISNTGGQNASSGVVAVTQDKNRWKGVITHVVGDELTSEDYFYVFPKARPGLVPFVIQKQSAPEERVWDKTSDFYKRSNKVAIAYIGRQNAAACFPHAILRVQITG